jgi:hypothetical protein
MYTFNQSKYVERYPVLTKKLAKTRERMAVSFINIFNDGPLVSFKGSPTVSPTTAAFKYKFYFMFFSSFHF